MFRFLRQKQALGKESINQHPMRHAIPGYQAGGLSTTSLSSGKRIENLSDETLSQILEIHFEATQERHIRLVSKRFHRLATPLSLRTISVRSLISLEKFVNAPNTTLLNPIYVTCFELCFLPLPSTEIRPNFNLYPNVSTIRFRFNLGISGNGDDLINGEVMMGNALSLDTISNASRPTFYPSLVKFLSTFKPKKFEWISSDNKTLSYIGFHQSLRQIFTAWPTLSHVLLDGVCLVDQRNLERWNISLPAQFVHIRTSFSSQTLSLLSRPDIFPESSGCRSLLLSESLSNTSNATRETSLSLGGSTLVTFVGWSSANRKDFSASLISLPTPTTLSGQPKRGATSSYQIWILTIILLYMVQGLLSGYKHSTPTTAVPRGNQASSSLLVSPHNTSRTLSRQMDKLDLDDSYSDEDSQPKSRPSSVSTISSQHLRRDIDASRPLNSSSATPLLQTPRHSDPTQTRTLTPVVFLTYYGTTSKGTWIVTSSYTTYPASGPTSTTLSDIRTHTSQPRHVYHPTITGI